MPAGEGTKSVGALAREDRLGIDYSEFPVAVLTGSKNAVKGIGFLLGSAALAAVGFEASVIGMAVVLALIVAAVAMLMPPGLPRGRKDAEFRAPPPAWRPSAGSAPAG